MKSKELEVLLRHVLVPVEPREVFVRRLRARLVEYRGGRPFSPWVILGVLAMAILLVLTWVGLLLRLASRLLGDLAGSSGTAGGEEALPLGGANG